MEIDTDSLAVSAAFEQKSFLVNDLNMEAILDVDLVNLKNTGIHLALTALLIDGSSVINTFQQIAEGAKANCIVSKALSVPITLSVPYQ